MLLMVVLMLTGCQTDEPSQKVGLPISICLPASEVKAAQYAPRRAFGDPGTTESYLFPHYLYIIVMKQKDDDSWMVWDRISRELTDADWIAECYQGVLPTVHDSIYRYKEEIDLTLATAVPGERQEFKGRVYAIASAVELSFSPALNAITNLDDLLALTFDASSSTIQDNLQHIYSTPYNLEDDGDYFGAFNSKAQRVPHVDLLLYHVAAKVDINWYVPTDKRYDKETPANGIRLTYMDACNLFNGNAYCFKPMENVAAAPLESGATKHIIGAGDEGMWWEGRSYFYTIPYTTTESGKENYYPLQMLMKTNGSAGAGYKPTIYMEIDKTSPFVPWLRATFNVSKQLTDGGSETKVVNLPTP